jgi:hypothetical protein
LLAIKEEWDGVDPQILENLIESMPERVAECIKNRGGHTN